MIHKLVFSNGFNAHAASERKKNQQAKKDK